LRKRKVTKNGAELKKNHSFKMLACSKECGREEKVDFETASVICWQCTAKSMPAPEIKYAPPKIEGPIKPKGWHFMEVFVDSEKNVFHKGKEQPELKGTLPVTPLKPKKTRAEKDAIKQKKENKLAKLYKKKQFLKEKENGKKQIRQNTNNISNEPVDESMVNSKNE
jgi:hypothetical protein